MGWPAAFTDALYQGFRAPRYLLEDVKVPAGVIRTFGGTVRLSSFPLVGYDPILRADGSTTSGGLLAVRDWSCSPVTFDIGVLGDGAKDLRILLQRGQVLALKVGFSDDPAEFATVAVGTVYGLGLSGRGWVIHCKGLEGSLVTRITGEAGQQQIGWNLAATTCVVYVGGATLTVASTTGFPSAGVVRITANSGSTYYVQYTGKTATTFTGCTTGGYGTAFSVTSGTKPVTEVMYSSGHPIEVAMRVLASTGTAGANGTFDTLDADWAFGIPRQLLDERDAIQFRDARQPSAGADDWQWVQAVAMTSAQDTLGTWLAGGGYYLTQVQGAVTCRGALEPWAQAPAGIEITDGDIVSIDGYEAWYPDTPSEYGRTRITYADTGSSTTAHTDLDHLPSLDVLAHAPGGVWSVSTPNLTAIVTEIAGILKQWDTRVPEWISLTLRSRWWAVLAPGDSVPLGITVLRSRTGFDFRGQRAYVIRASCDWFGADDVTRVELLVLPADENVPWRLP